MASTLKLYRVTCRGAGIGWVFFAVSTDATSAYRKVRDDLDEHNRGYTSSRELERIELLAEQTCYPDCGTILYV
ncbi:MAG TPA: hypothetical protein VN444_04255 [Verrucomicrobiae bacterium]|nr:hypothetical protein [Verrucomicrobiae bacterium]